jgi:hypothetical protein
MNIFTYEAKKIFLHKRGLLFIGIYLLVCVISLLVADKPRNAEIENNLTQYNVYLQLFQGEYTPEKAATIESEYSRIDSAKISAQKLYNEYYDGKITKDELTRETSRLEAVFANQKGFELLYAQNIYVRENPANRYFVYTNGWDGLLSGENLDIFLVLLVLLLMTPVFCYEHESSMGILLVSLRRGGAYQAVCKIILAAVTVSALCVLSFGLHYAFFSIKYGLPGANYPLQSLSYFASSTKYISLAEAFVLTSALKIVGYLSFAVMVLAVSKLTQKYAVTVFSCSALILLPYFGFSMPSAKYFLPLPLGFMVANGFLRGSETEKNVFTDEIVTIFNEAPTVVLIFLIALILVISAALITLVVSRSKNKWSGKRNIIKTLSLVFTVCLMTVISGGCASKTGNADVFNLSTRMTYENEQYRVFVEESDLANIHLAFLNKETGEIENFVRDPLRELSEIENTVYGNKSLLYYIKRSIDNSGFRGVVDKFFVIQVDLNDFSETVIYEHNINLSGDSFLGLLDTAVERSEIPLPLSTAANAFFVDDQSIYIASEPFLQIDRSTHTIKTLGIPTNRSVAYDGESIYYISDKSEVVRYDTANGQESAIPNIVATVFYLTETELFYLNRLDKNRLYSMDLATGKTEQIDDREMLYFYCDNEYIYFTENKPVYALYRMEKDGDNCVIIEG